MIECITEIMQLFMNGLIENVFGFMTWMVVVVKYNVVALHVTVSRALGLLRVVVFITRPFWPIDAELVAKHSAKGEFSNPSNSKAQRTWVSTQLQLLKFGTACTLYASSCRAFVFEFSTRSSFEPQLSLPVGPERSVDSALISVCLNDGMSFLCCVRELEFCGPDLARVRERQDGRCWRNLENQRQLIHMKVSADVGATHEEPAPIRALTQDSFCMLGGCVGDV